MKNNVPWPGMAVYEGSRNWKEQRMTQEDEHSHQPTTALLSRLPSELQLPEQHRLILKGF